MRGQSLSVQDGREVVVRPGDLCIRRSDSPFTMIDDAGYRRDQVLVTVADLALPPRLIQQITTTKVCPGHPIADLAAAYFYRLMSDLRLESTRP